MKYRVFVWHQDQIYHEEKVEYIFEIPAAIARIGKIWDEQTDYIEKRAVTIMTEYLNEGKTNFGYHYRTGWKDDPDICITTTRN